MTQDEVLALIKRDAVDLFSYDGLRERLNSGRPLKIKLGADPSRPDLHLGHSVVLKKLRLLQDAGHEIWFVIGDFTGMIGDPSGRSRARPPLTFGQTRENGQSYFEQVTKILDPKKTNIAYNSEWLGKLGFADVLALAGKYTLAGILERDDFKQRYLAQQPIGLHELFYPLMQGYDSVALHADIEVGGTDQTFNLLVGRALQKDYGQIPQEVVTFPLLPGLDGIEKMSKSLDNYIGISEPADVMLEKCMRVPDTVLGDYFRLTTDIAPERYIPLMEQDMHLAHFLFAREIVTLYHGAAAAEEAERRYREIAAGKAPERMETLVIRQESVSIAELLKLAGFASSNSEARRLIVGKGVKFNGEIVNDKDLIIRENGILSRGKSKFRRVAFERDK
ncbi:MAG TPA: tyrosine--tRNA ligase [Feifaniaceae bacterium]|nr:tyrosine--tRNA ligase [Feifaniaceae bacterium]